MSTIRTTSTTNSRPPSVGPSRGGPRPIVVDLDLDLSLDRPSYTTPRADDAPHPPHLPGRLRLRGGRCRRRRRGGLAPTSLQPREKRLELQGGGEPIFPSLQVGKGRTAADESSLTPPRCCACRRMTSPSSRRPSKVSPPSRCPTTAPSPSTQWRLDRPRHVAHVPASLLVGGLGGRRCQRRHCHSAALRSSVLHGSPNDNVAAV